MLASTLHQRIAYGLAKAAAITGSAQPVYRPLTSNDPVSGVPLRMLTCAFDNSATFPFRSTALPGHPLEYLLGDPTLVLAGDYIVGDEAHFVAAVEPLRPALCVRCNQTVSILNPDLSTSAGTNAYGGRTADSDVVIARNWPVSMLSRGRLDTQDAKLPGDTRAGSFGILCPPIPNVVIEYGMRVQDAAGQNYSITSAEFSQFGWNLLLGIASA